MSTDCTWISNVVRRVTSRLWQSQSFSWSGLSMNYCLFLFLFHSGIIIASIFPYTPLAVCIMPLAEPLNFTLLYSYLFFLIFLFPLSRPFAIRIGHTQLTFVLGGVIAIASFLWLLFESYTDQIFTTYGIYLVSAAIGISGSTMFITSVGITNDLIGHNTVSPLMHLFPFHYP